jgi:hypothetical protein
MQTDQGTNMRNRSRPSMHGQLMNILIGLSAGLAGGLARGVALQRPILTSALYGAVFGLLFTLLVARRASSAGTGLIWGLGSAFTIWLLLSSRVMPIFSAVSHSGAMLYDVRLRFPDLVADLLCLGTPVGLAVGTFGTWQTSIDRPRFSWGRAVVAGGVAGIFAGLIFGYWMLVGSFFPLLAGLTLPSGRFEAATAQFAVALIIGVAFGILFQRDVHSYGSCMGWGLGFGIFWWFLGPLTLFPWISGLPLDWSAQNANGLYGPLIGHILYGLILGVSYATFDRVWLRLFFQSDPLNRKPEGPGLHLLRSLQWGAAAGLAGGLISCPVMIATGVLSRVAGTDTSLTGVGGLLTHLVMSTLIGMSFGLLFRDESPNLPVGVLWGCLFGMIWWYAGPVTLLPLFLTGEIDWRAGAISSLLPALIGHLLYGGSTAFFFILLERRYIRRIRLNSRSANLDSLPQRPLGNPAPALWMFAIGLGMLLPILLS